MDSGNNEWSKSDVSIDVKGHELSGELVIPPEAKGLIIFTHGSGSGRHSPRNQYVARAFQEVGLGTLLFDLLTAEEEAGDYHTGRLRFDIPLLASRLQEVTDWVNQTNLHNRVAVAYFGASTGAAAALIAAAELGDKVAAVVSRGGRLDLARDYLDRVTAPTLLIVGGRDFPVIEMNREAFDRMRCKRVMQLIPGATHLFEESGALEKVSTLASDWFLQQLTHQENSYAGSGQW